MRTHDDLAESLRALRAWSGLSYRAVHREVSKSRQARGIPELPSYNTVYRSFQGGRARVDRDVVVDIARALAGDEAAAQWLHACQVVAGEANESAIAAVAAALPEDLAPFVGRADELSRILAEVRAVDGGTPVVAISGMAGVGKTTLAVRASHLLIADGHGQDAVLAVNLRGFDDRRPPVDPTAALDGFLRQLGVPGSQISTKDVAGRAALLCERLSGKRALILLDNAASVEQIRPLIPDVSGTAVVVTSRRPLVGPQDGIPINLEVFDEDEALEALQRMSVRSGEDVGGAQRLVESVGRLPLGIAVLGSSMRRRADLTVADHADLVEQRRSLLRIESEVEGAISLSVDGLSLAAQDTLRRLALHPGTDWGIEAAAALIDESVETTRRRVSELTDASLASVSRRGRVELHDLVRVHALAAGHEIDVPRVSRAAMWRLLDHYRFEAYLAMSVYAPQEKSYWPSLDAPSGMSVVEPTLDEAVEWLEREIANVVAVASYAADHALGECVDHFSLILFRFLMSTGRLDEASLIHHLAVQCTTGAALGKALSRLGWAHVTAGHLELGRRTAEDALVQSRESGDRVGEASALVLLIGLDWRAARYVEVEGQLRDIVEIYRDLGDDHRRGTSLQNRGSVLTRLGRLDEAAGCYEDAVAAAAEASNGERQRGRALESFGEVRLLQGRFDEARELQREGLEISRRLRDLPFVCDALNVGARIETRAATLESVDIDIEHSEAIALADEIAEPFFRADTRTIAGDMLRSVGRFGDAEKRYREALEIASGDLVLEAARAQEGMAWCLHSTGHPDEARVLAKKTQAAYEQMSVALSITTLPRLLAELGN
ncbi:hypothetical protein VV02_25450 [Luteipulveratus mongoliensis]|uniref:AAA+ ATPase domain-containing protein n=1 Tax=Luteipulveratus mongoliensis TaxID=571913 RepID=A0A0K1JNW8_9MICO|nr:hypothetical protein VV02_25450 [Luteipulveratus mongoliensis]